MTSAPALARATARLAPIPRVPPLLKDEMQRGGGEKNGGGALGSARDQQLEREGAASTRKATYVTASVLMKSGSRETASRSQVDQAYKSGQFGRFEVHWVEGEREGKVDVSRSASTQCPIAPSKPFPSIDFHLSASA
jgi:hypothetical protein